LTAGARQFDSPGRLWKLWPLMKYFRLSAASPLCRLIGLFVVLLFSGCLIDRIGGAFTQKPEDLEISASDATKRLIDQAFDGIDPGRLVDFHTHVIAIGTSVKDAFINSKMRSGINLERLKFLLYASASDIKNIDNTDQE
ncbi:MAG: hypothetical protein ACXWXZ_20750, partial [Candidatus Binatia bacterium]